MNIEKAILTRRRTRKFTFQKVEEEKILKLIEAAKQAPTGGNSQSIHLIVIGNKEILTR